MKVHDLDVDNSKVVCNEATTQSHSSDALKTDDSLAELTAQEVAALAEITADEAAALAELTAEEFNALLEGRTEVARGL